MLNLTFGSARSGYANFAISMPRRKINQMRNIVILSSLKGPLGTSTLCIFDLCQSWDF